MRLVLASQSQIRAKMLRQAGLRFEILPANVDETPIGPPLERAASLAALKAATISRQQKGALVIGADQVGILSNGVELQKPMDATQASAQIAQMSGNKHQFRSAVSVWRDGVEIQHCHEDAWVTFRELSPQTLAWYVGTGEWQGCCGGYQIENQGIQLVEKIEGSLMAIYGLPLVPLLDILRGEGFLESSKGPSK